MTTIKLAIMAAVVGIISSAGSIRANNLTVSSHVTINSRDANSATIKFDLAWENSWRYTNVNHDAAWVFFKIQKKGDVSNSWRHVVLEGSGINPTDYSTGTGTGVELIVPPDRLGVFVRRSAEGSGPVSVQNVQVVWNYASTGLRASDQVRVQVFAVEMVFVAEGSYYVGSGGTPAGTDPTYGGTAEQASFTDGSWTSGTSTSIPFQIVSEGELILTNAAGYLWSTVSNSISFYTNSSEVLPAAFPKGFAPFYCMKYETTQGQYRDFLNALTRQQQKGRLFNVEYAVTNQFVADYFALARNSPSAVQYAWTGIRYPGTIPDEPTSIEFGCDADEDKVFNETNDAMDRVCNALSWEDGCAFADWAALRPMTELEFEKACRGDQSPVPNECAWGNTNIVPTAGVTDPGTGIERATSGNCNSAPSYDGYFRAGIYATAASSRTDAGASYWGIMELSGSGYDHAVTLGKELGRQFTGLTGDGELTPEGKANVTAWPTNSVPTGNKPTVGSGYRGGNWSFGSVAVSDRSYATSGDTRRLNRYAWRAVRQAPSGVTP